MQSSDLFPCGERVHMPSVRGSGYTRPTLSTACPRGDPSCGEQLLRGGRSGAGKLRTRVNELGSALAFSDEVVSEHSPQSVSYSKARDDLRALFKARSVVEADRGARVSSRPRRRHHLPCHLQRFRDPPLPERSYLQSLPAELSHTSVQRPSGANMRAETVFQSESLPWAERTLQRLSSSTAVDLASSRSCREVAAKKTTGLVLRGSETSVPQEEEEEVGGAPVQQQAYLQQLQRGAKPVFSDATTIVLDNHTRFEKVLQPTCPGQPGDWCASRAAPAGGFTRGYRKWLDFPQPCKTPEELQWVCRHADHSSEEGEGEVSLQGSAAEGTSGELFEVLREWSAMWHIHLQLKDTAGCSAVLEDLASLCDNTRKAAVLCISLIAERELKSASLLHVSPSQQQRGQWVGPAHVAGLERLLTDPVEHVRVPVALSLLCMDKHSDQAKEVLLAAVNSASHPESWASVQCLALTGTAPAPVVSKLITHLVDSKHGDKAADLLARCSAGTNLVHALLAEQLNSSGWRERQAACLLLPRLDGGLSQDVCGKLVHLAWEDWRSEVKQAAAQALGRSGHAKLIHDEIAARLTSTLEGVKLDALRKLHALRLMTAALLPAFLSCFDDTHMSVREEAVQTACSLRLADPRVLARLQVLLRDPCDSVKALVFRALGAIGKCDEALEKQLLWAVRFEKLPAVRVEACRTIASLAASSSSSRAVVEALQSLLLVEDDTHVQREAMETLSLLGSSVAMGDEMLEVIRSEVQRRGTRESITSAVVGRGRRALAAYVLEERPCAQLSSRDYLQEQHRSRHYRPRTWSPDRRTIDTQLSAMRRHCHNTGS